MTRWQRWRRKLWELLGDAGWAGMDRRQWWWRRSLIAYRTIKPPFLLLFFPHVAMIIFMTFLLPGTVVAWLLGYEVDADGWIFSGIALVFSLPFWVFIPVCLGHRATIIDTRGRTVTEWRGMALPFLPIIPFLWRRHDLGDFTAVQVTEEVTKTGKSSQAVYRLKLVGGRAPDVLVVEKRRLLGIRRIAEHVARQCGLPLHDKTADEITIRQVDELDLPLVETAGSTCIPEPPVLPATSMLRLPERGTRPWEATSARASFRGWRSLWLALLCGVLAYVACLAQPGLERLGKEQAPPLERPAAHWQPPSPWPGRLARIGEKGVVLVGYVAGFTAVACLLIWSGHVLLRPFGWRIVVDAQGLCVERIGMFGRRWPRRRRLSLRELEELRTEKLGLHWRLLAIGDRRIIPIGSIFTHADVHALRQEMVLALRAEAAPR